MGLVKGKMPKAITERIGRHVVKIRRILRIPSKKKRPCDHWIVKSVTKRDMNR